MAGWRDLKAKMLATVHRTFEIEGVYLTHVDGEPIRVNVRIHRKPTVERLTFGDFNDAADAWAAEDIIVFDKAQVSRPLLKAMLIISRKEGYHLGAAKPEQDGYMHVAVTEMTVDAIQDVLAKVDTDHPAWAGLV